MSGEIEIMDKRMHMHPCLSGEERVGVSQCRGASPSLHNTGRLGTRLDGHEGRALSKRCAVVGKMSEAKPSNPVAR